MPCGGSVDNTYSVCVFDGSMPTASTRAGRPVVRGCQLWPPSVVRQRPWLYVAAYATAEFEGSTATPCGPAVPEISADGPSQVVPPSTERARYELLVMVYSRSRLVAAVVS